MSKSLESKFNYSVRRDMRLRRDKAALALMPRFITNIMYERGDYQQAAKEAVKAADTLLDVLDATRKDLAPQTEAP